MLNGKEYLLDIEQAKKLNLLKEKDNRVRSWEEFKKKYKEKTGWMVTLDEEPFVDVDPISTYEQLTEHEAKALAAFSKLLKLRRDWIGEWEPDWANYHICKSIICYVENTIKVNTRNISARSLSFPTAQMAEEFLNTFYDLIEEAKILI